MVLDNKQNGLVGETLKTHLARNASLSVVTNRFSLFAYQKLQKEFEQLHDVRLLFGSPYLDADVPTSLLGDENEIVERNTMQQRYIAKKCAKWIEEKVEVEEAKVPGTIPTKLFHIKSVNDVAISGSSDLTCSGLGYCPSNSFDMNTLITNKENSKQLLGWFNSLWNYLLAFSYILQIGDAYLVEQDCNGMLILDEQDEWEKPTNKTFNILTTLSDEPEVQVEKLLDRSFFVDSIESNMIQLADILAYTTMRYLETEIREMSKKKIAERKKLYNIYKDNIYRPDFNYGSHSVLKWLEDNIGNQAKDKPIG